jgi:hypothetical protein
MTKEILPALGTGADCHWLTGYSNGIRGLAGHAVRRAGRVLSWPSRARAGVSARLATAAEWRRQLRISSTASFPRCPCGRIARIRYVLPRHKDATWVGPGRDRKSTRPGANGVVELSPFQFWTASPISSRRRGSTGIGITASLHPTTSSGPPSRRSRSGTSASGKRPRRAGIRTTGAPQEAAATRLTSHSSVR